MIQYYKTVEGQLLEQNCASPGAWIHLYQPTKEEIEEVCAQTGVLVDLLTAALDEEEAARIEREEDQTLVLVDIPVVEPEGTSFVYNTLPLGIVLLDNMVITVCLEDTTIIDDFMENRVRGFDTCKKTRFVLQLVSHQHEVPAVLRQIDKASTQVEAALHKSMKTAS